MKTIFCDIDGTLCVHHEDIVRQHSEESHREQLEQQLRNAGIFWDGLVMGLSNGPRVMINDVKEGGEDRALGYNVTRNMGVRELKNL